MRKIFPVSSPHLPNRMDDSEEDKQTRRLSPLFRRLLKIKVWLIERFRLSERQITLIWAGFIGFLGALASEGFRKASELLHYVAKGSNLGVISSFAHLSWWQRIIVPATGGLLAGLTLWWGSRFFSGARQKPTTDT